MNESNKPLPHSANTEPDKPAHGPTAADLKQLQDCDIEAHGHSLLLTPRKSFDDGIGGAWWNLIIDKWPGPYQTVSIDLRHLQVVTSSFIAGAIQLVEHYRGGTLERITLLNTSDRISRLIDIMNLREMFTVHQTGANGL